VPVNPCADAHRKIHRFALILRRRSRTHCARMKRRGRFVTAATSLTTLGSRVQGDAGGSLAASTAAFCAKPEAAT
jgi:hypothetical protein